MDPDINALLNSIRSVLGQSTERYRSHLTVRGPYYEPITKEEVEKWSRVIEDDTLLIANIGQFYNERETVVFFRVNSDNLEKIWSKPDYDVQKYGFNPHISVYRGRDRDFADVVANFLKNEQIEMLCHQFHLTPHVSKQIELFPEKQRRQQFFGRVAHGRVSVTVLRRLKSLVMDYEKATEGLPNGDR